MNQNKDDDDPFILNYQPSELKIAAEFLTNWLPFLTKDLCRTCTHTLSNRIRSLDPDHVGEETHDDCDSDTNLLGSWTESANGFSTSVPESSQTTTNVESPSARMLWGDIEEDELDDYGEVEGEEVDKHFLRVEVDSANSERRVQSKTTLSREKREYIRFRSVKRKKDFACFERINGKLVNILDGLELHTGVFSAAEQKRIVDLIYSLEEKGRNRELRARTFSAPKKWMKGKGRMTIQFGCCYNYAVSKDGREPGILQDEHVDPIPPLFKVIIRRLVGWHILPPTCVPDSCIVNIYDEGDCIPPHIDHHDFVRPFCTVSFLSECNIVFGTTLKPVGPGDFGGSAAIPLPVGSVLVLKGNGADVAKHCVPAVPTRRISITFRKMAESKCPHGFVPEPDLQGLQPLPYDVDESNVMSPPKSPPLMKRHPVRQVDYDNRREFSSRGNRSESRYFGQRLQPLPYDVDESNVMYPPKSPPLVNRQPVRQVVSENGRGFSGRGNNSEPRYFGQTRSHPEGRRRMRVSLGT